MPLTKNHPYSLSKAFRSLLLNLVLLIYSFRTPSTISLQLQFHYPSTLSSQHIPFPSAVFLPIARLSHLSTYISFSSGFIRLPRLLPGTAALKGNGLTGTSKRAIKAQHWQSIRETLTTSHTDFRKTIKQGTHKHMNNTHLSFPPGRNQMFL